MDSRSSRYNEDPLGFTKQTATMLVGLGAQELIPQFRKKNISSQDLAALSKQDLLVLGADEDLADDMLRQLRAAARKYGGRDLSEELRTNQLINVLTSANRQLNLIQIFLGYARARLEKNPQDFIIDYNKNQRASEALCAASACIRADVRNLESNYHELLLEVLDDEYERVTRKSLFFKLLGRGAALVILTYMLLST